VPCEDVEDIEKEAQGQHERGDLGQRALQVPSGTASDDITESNVLSFLDHLESARGNSVATRNSRLTAIRSFCRYLIRKDTTHAAEYGLIVSIPGKKGPRPDIPYLQPAEIKLLLEQANQDQLLGLRDYTLIQSLYNTACVSAKRYPYPWVP
jgi:site-specific recombinase XerD